MIVALSLLAFYLFLLGAASWVIDQAWQADKQRRRARVARARREARLRHMRHLRNLRPPDGL